MRKASFTVGSLMNPPRNRFSMSSALVEPEQRHAMSVVKGMEDTLRTGAKGAERKRVSRDVDAGERGGIQG